MEVPNGMVTDTGAAETAPVPELKLTGLGAAAAETVACGSSDKDERLSALVGGTIGGGTAVTL